MTRLMFSLVPGPDERFPADAFDDQLGDTIPVTLASGATTTGTVEKVSIVDGGRNAKVTIDIDASASDLSGGVPELGLAPLSV